MKAWAAREGTSAEFRVIAQKWLKHCVQVHNVPSLSPRSGNGMYQGAFAFTLTASPTDGKTEEDMVRAVRKVMHQKSCPVKRYAWYLEYGDVEQKKHPHIHGMYETTTSGVIERKYWKRAWDLWDPTKPLGSGFRGGYHRPVRDDERYEQYIAKQKIRGESRDASQDLPPPPPPPSPETQTLHET